ncbi:MAG: response regulator transcription factor [Candidatus Zixiibacteriota bacterium]
MMKKKILIVEDEAHISDGIQMNMEAQGYEAVIAADGHAALEVWRRGAFDLIILDIMLPGIDGLTVCRTIRKEGDRIPILFLTARDQTDDRVEGIIAGGDDYLTKPFSLKELLVRVSAIFRRQAWFSDKAISKNRFSFGEFWIDFKSFHARGVDGERELSQKECMIMKLLTEHADEVVTRDMILDAVWGYDIYPSNRTVDNFIVKLRKIFESDTAHPKYLHTIWGTGYKFTPGGEA